MKYHIDKGLSPKTNLESDIKINSYIVLIWINTLNL